MKTQYTNNSHVLYKLYTSKKENPEEFILDLLYWSQPRKPIGVSLEDVIK